MKNLKIKEISSFGQKQGENTKIRKFSWESGRLGSYIRVYTDRKVSQKLFNFVKNDIQKVTNSI